VQFTGSGSYKNRRRPDRRASFHFTVDGTNINSRRARYLYTINKVSVHFDPKRKVYIIIFTEGINQKSKELYDYLD